MVYAVWSLGGETQTANSCSTSLKKLVIPQTPTVASKARSGMLNTSLKACTLKAQKRKQSQSRTRWTILHGTPMPPSKSTLRAFRLPHHPPKQTRWWGLLHTQSRRTGSPPFTEGHRCTEHEYDPKVPMTHHQRTRRLMQQSKSSTTSSMDLGAWVCTCPDPSSKKIRYC